MSAARATALWVRLYTHGLDATARETRSAEIASDLWEQQAAAGSGLATEAAILSRLVRGIPADLSWRRARRRRALTAAAIVRGVGVTVWAAAYLFLLVTHAYAATPFLGLDLYGGVDWEDGVWAYATAGLVLLVLMLAGTALLLCRRRRLGAATLSAGALGTAAVFAWGIAVYGPAALIVTAGLVRRFGRRAAPAI